MTITWSPPNLVAGAAITLSATIKNQGAGPTPAGTVHCIKFFIDGKGVAGADQYAQALPIGSAVTITANAGPDGKNTWPATPGTHTVEAFVDDIDCIAESNEANNKFSKTLMVESVP